MIDQIKVEISFLRSTSTSTPVSKNSPMSSSNSTDSLYSPKAAKDNEGNTNNSVNHELRMLIENELLFLLFSLDVKPDHSALVCFLSQGEHLFRIFNFLIRQFDSYNNVKLTSAQIYYCLSNMKFDANDKVNYTKELIEYNKTGVFSHGLNISLCKLKDDFYRTKECIDLRVICSTGEFRDVMKKTYVKYLIEKLCIKSKQIRDAIFWFYNRLKTINGFKTYRAFNVSASSFKLNHHHHNRELQKKVSSGFLNFKHLDSLHDPVGFRRKMEAESKTFDSSLANTSMFELKLLNYYYINKRKLKNE